MISILSTNSRIFDLKMDFLTFAWAKPCEIVLQFFDKIEFLNKFPYEGADLMGVVGRRKKLRMKNWPKLVLRGLKLRGLWWSQKSSLNFIYQIDQRKKMYAISDFGNKTTMHLGAAHAISKIDQKFQNRVSRESDKNFDNPRIRMIHWMGQV